MSVEPAGACEDAIPPQRFSQLSKGTSGHEIMGIGTEELEQLNNRMLAHTEKSYFKGFIIPREIPMELLRIRVIFTRLQEQTRRNSPSTRRNSTALYNDDEDKVPIEAFQRAFERLFFLLNDPLGFNAKDYDENSDGFVSWGEFFHVYRRRNIKINLSICERIFLTFDDPDSSHLAQIVSAVVLMTIIVSSCCFILGTLPEWQIQEPPLAEPKPAPEFEAIENTCLVLFVLEYVARLLTVWAVRLEIFDEEKVLDLVIGFEPLKRTQPAVRMLKFVLAPSNLIDLAAILPALLSLFMQQEDGSGFVVLRLIRLTRIFRAFKNPALAEPVIVISQTISQSTKALYVLVFNLLLGIVIFGSLMYLAEGQGEWNVEDQVYRRKSGRLWNSTSLEWEDEWEHSPFVSIPHTFWWAIVTATTVGYGDIFVRTTLGKVVAVLTMVFSLVILALPVGVIGGTFSQVWDDYKTDRQCAAQMRQKEMLYITSAIQRLDPARMSKLMLIEVWNDPLGQHSGVVGRPSPARFMGEVTVEMELPRDRPVTKTQTLRLGQNSDLVKRTITGQLTVRYEWVPRNDLAGKAEMGEHVHSESFELFGKLRVTIVCAESLVNLDFTRRNGASSPYCMVLCYPSSPVDRQLCPSVWRTPTVANSLNPQWEASHSFDFSWRPSGWQNAELAAASAGAFNGSKAVVNSPRPATKTEELLRLLRELNDDLGQVRQEVREISGRVDKFSALKERGSASPSSEPVDAGVLLPNWVPAPE